VELKLNMQDDYSLAEFTASIIEAAKASIPTTSTIPKHINKTLV